MLKEWCPKCQELTTFVDDGLVSYGEEHKAQCTHCVKCGETVFGKLNRVKGITMSQQHSITLSMMTMKENPVPYEAEEIITFRVHGSQSTPYTIFFWRIGEKVDSQCNCMASRYNQMCKHRQKLISGDMSRVIDADDDAMILLDDMLGKYHYNGGRE